MTAAGERPSLREPLAVWALFATVLLVSVVTYARVDPGLLWNVSGEGVVAGLSRALVYLNFPVALVAVAVVLVVEERVRRPLLATVAIALSAVTAVPGVVDQEDLDAKWVNAVPAVGVALALFLTAAAYRRGGPASASRRRGSTSRGSPWPPSCLRSPCPGSARRSGSTSTGRTSPRR